MTRKTPFALVLPAVQMPEQLQIGKKRLQSVHLGNFVN